MLGASVERHAVGFVSPDAYEVEKSGYRRFDLYDSAVTSRVYQTLGVKQQCYASPRAPTIGRWSKPAVKPARCSLFRLSTMRLSPGDKRDPETTDPGKPGSVVSLQSYYYGWRLWWLASGWHVRSFRGCIRHLGRGPNADGDW